MGECSSTSSGRAVSSRRVCAPGQEPVLQLGSAPALTDRHTDRQMDPAVPGMERCAGNGPVTLPWVTDEPGTVLGQPVSVSSDWDGWGWLMKTDED